MWVLLAFASGVCTAGVLAHFGPTVVAFLGGVAVTAEIEAIVLGITHRS